MKRLKKILAILGITLVVLAIAVFVALKMTLLEEFPQLVETPKQGKWYEVTPDGLLCANGDPYHAVFRKGKENKLIVYFFGGGVSVDEYTAARGFSVSDEGFYSDNEDNLDFYARLGIGSQSEGNPFKDWSILAMPYSTGDFHCGTGDFPYTDLQGKPAVLHHHGYTNLCEALAMVRNLVGSPEALLVTGFSAGGFGSALMADEVISHFPETPNVTVFVDSSVLLYDEWPKVAHDVWQAPKAIANRVVSDNITLDCLRALRHERGNAVKILFGCSVRDEALCNVQVYFDEGQLRTLTHQDGDRMQQVVRSMVEGLQEGVPGCGIFIWDDLKSGGDAALTAHTILPSPFEFHKPRGANPSVSQWLMDAVNGNVRSFGVELVNKTY